MGKLFLPKGKIKIHKIHFLKSNPIESSENFYRNHQENIVVVAAENLSSEAFSQANVDFNQLKMRGFSYIFTNHFPFHYV